MVASMLTIDIFWGVSASFFPGQVETTEQRWTVSKTELVEVTLTLTIHTGILGRVNPTQMVQNIKNVRSEIRALNLKNSLMSDHRPEHPTRMQTTVHVKCEVWREKNRDYRLRCWPTFPNCPKCQSDNSDNSTSRHQHSWMKTTEQNQHPSLTQAQVFLAADTHDSKQ